MQSEQPNNHRQKSTTQCALQENQLKPYNSSITTIENNFGLNLTANISSSTPLSNQQRHQQVINEYETRKQSQKIFLQQSSSNQNQFQYPEQPKKKINSQGQLLQSKQKNRQRLKIEIVQFDKQTECNQQPGLYKTVDQFQIYDFWFQQLLSFQSEMFEQDFSLEPTQDQQYSQGALENNINDLSSSVKRKLRIAGQDNRQKVPSTQNFSQSLQLKKRKFSQQSIQKIRSRIKLSISQEYYQKDNRTKKNININQGLSPKIIRVKNYRKLTKLIKKFKQMSSLLKNLENMNYQSIFLQSCVRYLLQRTKKVWMAEQTQLIGQIEQFLNKLKEWQQQIFQKLELSYEMSSFYRLVQNNTQEMNFQSFHQLFKNLFIKESIILLRLKKQQIWRKIYTIILRHENIKKFQIQDIINLLKTELLNRIERQNKLQLQQLEKIAKQYQRQAKTAKLFLQKRLEKRFNSSKLASKNRSAQFKQLPNTKILMVLQVNLDLIALVCDCQTYESPFLLFLVPFTYLLAQTLAYYELQSSKNLSIYQLYQELIKKINFMKNQKNTQINEAQLMDHIINFVNYIKYTPSELNNMMGRFLEKHGGKMQGFIPVYYDIFYFYAFQKRELINRLSQLTDMKLKRTFLLQRIEKLYNDCQRHHKLND